MVFNNGLVMWSSLKSTSTILFNQIKNLPDQTLKNNNQTLENSILVMKKKIKLVKFESKIS